MSFNAGLFEPSPFKDTLWNFDGLIITWFFKFKANPKKSNPGPKLALVAGTRILRYSPF